MPSRLTLLLCRAPLPPLPAFCWSADTLAHQQTLPPLLEGFGLPSLPFRPPREFLFPFSGGIQLVAYLYCKRACCISSSLLPTSLGCFVMIYCLGVMKGALELFPESLNSILTVYEILNIKNDVIYNSQPKHRRKLSPAQFLPSLSACGSLSWAVDHGKHLHLLPCASSLLLTPREP